MAVAMTERWLRCTIPQQTPLSPLRGQLPSRGAFFGAVQFACLPWRGGAAAGGGEVAVWRSLPLRRRRPIWRPLQGALFLFAGKCVITGRPCVENGG